VQPAAAAWQQGWRTNQITDDFIQMGCINRVRNSMASNKERLSLGGNVAIILYVKQKGERPHSAMLTHQDSLNFKFIHIIIFV